MERSFSKNAKRKTSLNYQQALNYQPTGKEVWEDQGLGGD